MAKRYKILKDGAIIESLVPGRYAGCKKTGIFGNITPKRVCTWGLRMKKENRVFFHSMIDAVVQGYRPCKGCRPMDEKSFGLVRNKVPFDTLEQFYNSKPMRISPLAFTHWHVDRAWHDDYGFSVVFDDSTDEVDELLGMYLVRSRRHGLLQEYLVDRKSWSVLAVQPWMLKGVTVDNLIRDAARGRWSREKLFSQLEMSGTLAGETVTSVALKAVSNVRPEAMLLF